MAESWTVPDQPMLKPWYRLAWDGPRLLLEYGQSLVVFEGGAVAELVPALLPLLDGSNTVEEIVASLGDAAAPAVDNALSVMARHGVLTAGSEGQAGDRATDTARLLAATAGRELTVPDVADRIRAATVAVVGSGGLAEEIGRALRLSGVEGMTAFGFDGVGGHEAHDLAIVAPASGELSAVANWNRHALAAGLVWLQALPFDGRYAALGPLFVPGETACYECFRIRRASNSGYADELDVLDDVPAAYPDTAPLLRARAGIATCHALRWIVQRDPLLPGVLYAFEWREGATVGRHHVYRVPRCPACSPAAGQAPPLPWFEGELRR